MVITHVGCFVAAASAVCAAAQHARLWSRAVARVSCTVPECTWQAAARACVVLIVPVFLAHGSWKIGNRAFGVCPS